MSFIVDVETERLVRLVAARSGCSPEAVVRHGVEHEARRFGIKLDDNPPPGDNPPLRMDRIRSIMARVAAAPLADARTAAQILDDAWSE